MLTEDKITELFCMTDDFCNFFDTMMEKCRVSIYNVHQTYYSEFVELTLRYIREFGIRKV